MFEAVLFWLGLMVFGVIVEANSVTLVSIWFSVGALAAAIAAWFHAELWIQILLFFGISGIFLALLRPMVRKYIKPKVVATNIDSVIGSTGYVTTSIDNVAAQGQVKLGAMEWTARSTDGSPIEEGKLVKVDKIEGVKALVSLVEV